MYAWTDFHWLWALLILAGFWTFVTLMCLVMSGFGSKREREIDDLEDRYNQS